ncbi:MAG: hypothetical protein ACI8YB_000747, partial [Patiriisocius sp.]
VRSASDWLVSAISSSTISLFGKSSMAAPHFA